jgi:hypothetical protein
VADRSRRFSTIAIAPSARPSDARSTANDLATNTSGAAREAAAAASRGAAAALGDAKEPVERMQH